MQETRSPRPLALAMTLMTLTPGLLSGLAQAGDFPGWALDGNAETGKAVAFDRAKGNCLACHQIAGGESPGSIGPVLAAIQTRYPSKEALAIQIWDATVKTPAAAMPPFGRHEILTRKEFVDVVEFIWSL